MIKKYIHNQIHEIAVDPVLRAYGFFLALLMLVTSIHWLVYKLQHWLKPNIEAICWPMFEQCRHVRILNATQLQIVFYALGIVGLFTAFFFLKQRFVKMAWLFLFVLSLIKYAIILMDYRMRLNQHIMVFVISFIFLFLPDKKKSIKILIILFYFWAGIIKLDSQWLSGSALYIKPWLISDALAPWACTYVVILEIFMIWALLYSKSWMAWITFAQLILFHVFSFKVVGFYYPLIMFALLSIFPISWWLEPKKGSLLAQFLSAHKIPYATLIVIFVFSFFQILPKTFAKDTSITGEGRLFALHMFDGNHRCKVKADIYINKRTFTQNLYLPLAARIRCDPAVYLSRARFICYKNRNNTHFQGMDLYLETKTSTDSNYRPVVDLKNFCAQNIQYNLFSSNPWIL